MVAVTKTPPMLWLDGPPPLDGIDLHEWLSLGEQAAYHAIGSPQRRATWLAGRLAAKRLVAARIERELAGSVGWAERSESHHSWRSTMQRWDSLRSAHPAPASIEIDSGGRRGGGPRAIVEGRELPWCLSIAHTASNVLVALAGDETTAVGVDLVQPFAASEEFLCTWFTGRERQWLKDWRIATLPENSKPDAQAREALPATFPRSRVGLEASRSRMGLRTEDATAVCWAIKEAVYKAACCNAPFGPRRFEVTPEERHGWLCRDASTHAVLARDIWVWRTCRGAVAAMAVCRRRGWNFAPTRLP